MTTPRTCLLLSLSLGLLACDTTQPDPGPEPPIRELVDGCDGSRLAARDPDPGQRGPWAVGTRSLEVGDLWVDVLYPAAPGSETGAVPMVADLRDGLPESQRPLVTDAKNPEVRCDCFSDLPLDTEAGPYPVIFFVHGTASWRTQSLSLMTHWASRGFIVAAADHPGLWLADLLAGICGEPVGARQDLNRDLRQLHDAFSRPSGGLSFIAGHVNFDRMAVAGHSAGASAASGAGDLPGIQTVISLAGNRSVVPNPNLSSALFLGGMADEVIPFSQTQRAHSETAQTSRLMGITGGGHLIFSDICELTNSDGQNLVEIASEAGVCGTQFASQLFDCAASSIPPAEAKRLVNIASTWVLERDLHCAVQPTDFEVLADEEWIEVLEVRD